MIVYKTSEEIELIKESRASQIRHNGVYRQTRDMIEYDIRCYDMVRSGMI